MLFIPLSHAAALLLWLLWFLKREVRVNAADIKTDGANDSLKRGYHSRRSWIRLLSALAFVAAAALVAWLLRVPSKALLPSSALLGVLLFGTFTRSFDPLLASARGLPRFYTSRVSQSWPDKPVWTRVRADNPGQADDDLQQTANEVHHHLLNYVLGGSLLVYVVGWVLLLLL